MFPTHLRNNAETARMITTFGNFHIDRVRRCESKAWSVIIGNVSWSRLGERKIDIFVGQHSLDDCSEFLHFIQPDEGVDFRHLLAQLAREALRHAPAYD